MSSIILIRTAPYPRELRDVIPPDKEEKMDVDSGYDQNPPSDSDLDEEWDSPRLLCLEYSDDSVILGITPRDMKIL